jgi:FAD synthase
MLNTVALTKQLHTKGGAMLLGGFDGLHVGHRLLVARAQESGLHVGIMTIVGGKERALFTFEEREEIFKNEGIDFAFELPFE